MSVQVAANAGVKDVNLKCALNPKDWRFIRLVMFGQ